MNKIRLNFKGVSEIVGGEGLALLFLADEDNRRQISIVCDNTVTRQLEERMAKVPVSSFMLPEVLCSLLQEQYGARMEIFIRDIVRGVYRTFLYCEGMEIPRRIRISDAVLLSLVGNVPVYIDEDLMAHQSVPCNSETNRIAVPINTLSDSMLDEAMEKAIAEENYELAQQINIERKRRKEEH